MKATPTTGDASGRAALGAARRLRWGVAFVWLWTGLAVLHPEYRRLGEEYLAPLGLPPAVMYTTCAAEVLLGLRVAFGRAATWVTLLQAVLIVGFTGILSASQPGLWLHPLGLLTKNLALLVMIGTAWRLERNEGGSGWLRFGMGAFWLVQGVLTLVGRDDPPLAASVRWAVWEFACAEIGVGVATVLVRGRLLQFLLAVYVATLGLFTLHVSLIEPSLWFHPFGPLTKNVPVAVAALVIRRYFSRRR